MRPFIPLFTMLLLAAYLPARAVQNKPLIVFVTGDQEYGSEETMPALAKELERKYGFRTRVLKAYPDQNSDKNIPGLDYLKEADLAIFFLRWQKLPAEQVAYIDAYLKSAKPIIAFRTSTHAFNYPNGDPLEKWNAFGMFALGAPPGWGADGHTHYGHESSTDVEVNPAQANHPILYGVEHKFHVRSWLYHVLPKHPPADAKQLLMGTSVNPDKAAIPNPVAWVWRNEYGSKVFTTTLGHPEDFQQEPVQRLIVNAVHWALNQPIPKTWGGKLDIDVKYKGLRKSDPPQASIQIDAKRVLNRISPWMYGSCIEDVNHEIYGGLYAQMIFGESFEEPPARSPLAGWEKFGGQWSVESDALHVEPDAGAKLIRSGPEISDGTVECDVRFDDEAGNNAGLILRVGDPHTGPDPWIGYEVSINARDKIVLLGRHDHNWEPLRTAPADIRPGQWYKLRADIVGETITIFLNSNSLITFKDSTRPVLSGRVGVRTWNSRASFRNLTIHTKQDEVFDRLDNAKREIEVSGMWDAFQSGSATPAYYWSNEYPYNSRRCQGVHLRSGEGRVGIANRGLNRWGISVKKDQVYDGWLFVRDAEKRLDVTVALQNADGSRTYAISKLKTNGNARWERHTFDLRCSDTDPKARFAIWIDRPGNIWIDQVSLMPTGRGLFRGGPFRADIGEGLVREGLTFLRYGGSMVNASEYRWKKMIGRREYRPQYRGWWYPYSTNGFGIEEFLQFCEKAHIEPAFAINIEETPHDAADLVEYLNGPVTSEWGKRRAINGHRKPYGVRFIEIGNEEAISGSKDEYAHYLERFKLLYDAMRPKDPSVQYVIAAWWRPAEPWCKQIVQDLTSKAALWDVHVGGDDPREGANVDHIFTEMQRLFHEWSPGTTMKAAVFEENGDRHDFQRALGHAAILNATRRHGDFVLMDCPANCLQPLGQNDNGWNQGQLFFTPDKVWGMPPYYAQQMAAQNHLPLRVVSRVTGDLDVTAMRSEDGKTLVFSVVNITAKSESAAIEIGGMGRVDPFAEVWTLSGDLKAVNAPEEPERAHPEQTRIAAMNQLSYTFPAHSFVILRLRASSP